MDSMRAGVLVQCHKPRGGPLGSRGRWHKAGSLPDCR